MENTGKNINNRQSSSIKTTLYRILIEVGFIIFLFYANLLMGEFSGTGQGTNNGLMWAIHNIFTAFNFLIAIIAALIGHLVFGYIRKKL
jgi:hypothetical protein